MIRLTVQNSRMAAAEGAPLARGGGPGGKLGARRRLRSIGATERLGEVGRQRRAHIDPSIEQRMVERQAGGMQKLALQAEQTRRCRTPDLRIPGGRSPAGERVSDGYGPSPGGGAGASVPVRARSSVKCVRASRGLTPPTAMRVRTRGSRPIGASIVPERAGGLPWTSARYSRSIRRLASARLQAACGPPPSGRR